MPSLGVGEGWNSRLTRRAFSKAAPHWSELFAQAVAELSWLSRRRGVRSGQWGMVVKGGWSRGRAIARWPGGLRNHSGVSRYRRQALAVVAHVAQLESALAELPELERQQVGRLWRLLASSLPPVTYT